MTFEGKMCYACSALYPIWLPCDVELATELSIGQQGDCTMVCRTLADGVRLLCLSWLCFARLPISSLA
jgi:hypothetical protein